MKHDVKTNLKLAGVCATVTMTLSGCGSKYTNVIEDISGNKVLVKDIKDGKQRIIEFGIRTNGWTWSQLKYSQIGDTIVVVEDAFMCGYEHDKHIPVYSPESTPRNGSAQYGVRFDKHLWEQRRYWEYKQQQQAEFDSLKCAIEREGHGKQR